jgi:hypothetical protein
MPDQPGKKQAAKIKKYFKMKISLKKGYAGWYKNKTGNFSCEKFPVHLQRSPVSVSSYCYYDWILFSGLPEKLCFPNPGFRD